MSRLGSPSGTPREPGETSIASRRPSRILGEVLLWLLVPALLSPLAIYAGGQVMPIAALFAVAAGIGLALALAGRQLHDILLADALSGRTNTARLVLGAGMMLLVVLFVLLGLVVAMLLLGRSARSPLPIP